MHRRIFKVEFEFDYIIVCCGDLKSRHTLSILLLVFLLAAFNMLYNVLQRQIKIFKISIITLLLPF